MHTPYHNYTMPAPRKGFEAQLANAQNYTRILPTIPGAGWQKALHTDRIHDTITSMHSYPAHLAEIRLQGSLASAWVACPPGVIPAPGRYVLAWALADENAPLATPLFAAEASEAGFLAAPPLPAHWQPGARLLLKGPLGHGFSLPIGVRRLALAALGETEARLLPLLHQALEGEAAVALFSDLPLHRLPAAVEVHPLDELPEAFHWADFLALDLPLPALPALRQRLGLANELDHLPCPAQALILAPMPCGGMGACGACSLPGRGRHWKLACQDGPVFELDELLR
ncbi:MAG: hypothetical protein AB1894_25730 [Chloroflexota bacterium]